VLRELSRDWEYVPDLPIGTTGILDGLAYVVTGFLKKQEEEEGEFTSWNEYLLYNKENGYITLVDFQGHWILVRPTDTKLLNLTGSRAHSVRYKDEEFKHYHSYYFKLLFISGAFDEDVLQLELAYTREYIAPPEMIVSEFLDKQTHWYHGRHITKTEVAKAFNIPESSLPKTFGVGVLQPSSYAAGKKWLGLFAGVMIAAIIAATILFSVVHPRATVLNNSYSLLPDSAVHGSSKMIVTEPFTLPTQGGVDIDLSANLSNEWLEASVTMVNDNDGSTYDFTKSLEYYSGVDGGESWSEGSQSETAFLGRIPAGTYHLNIFPFSEKELTTSLTVKVKKNPVLWSNIILIILAILGLPVINNFLNKRFEKKRLGDD